MAQDVSLHEEASGHSSEAYSKKIIFRRDNSVDVSSLTADEKRKLLLQCVEKDAVTTVVERFLSTHDKHQLRDLHVEDMRKIIPKLFLYCDDRDVSCCKRVKGLWDSRPKWWNADVPFMDPNNRKRSKHAAGFPDKKPMKDELVLMLEYLFQLCKEKMCQNAAVMPAVSSADVTLHSPMSCHSALSCDSLVASSSVLSPLSVRPLDHAMDIDSDYSPSPASTGLQQCQSSDTAIYFDIILQQIHSLPQSEHQQLMMDVHNTLRQQSHVTPELMQKYIKHLAHAVASCRWLVSIKAKYSSCSRLPSASDVSSAGVKHETAAVCQRYGSQNVTDEQHWSTADILDGNMTSDLSADQDLLLTDISDVISCDTTENCDSSTRSVSCHLPCQLEPAISSARLSTELPSDAVASQVCVSTAVVCSTAASPAVECTENTASELPDSLSRSCRLSAALSADQKQQNLPKSPT